MKIFITSQGKTLDSNVEPRFGRSPYFIIYDTDTKDFELIENPNATEPSGVGIKSGQIAANKNVNVVLTGQVGPKAFDTLQAAGIEIVDNVTGIVKDAIDKYIENSGNAFKKTEKNDISQPAGAPKQKQTFQVLGRGGIGRGRSGGRGLGSGKGQGHAGSDGYCVCPKCGEKTAHQPGIPCRSMTCKKCGTIMVKE